LLLFAILIGCHELLMVRTDPIRFDSFRRRFGAMVLVFAAPAVLYAVSDLGHMPDAPEFRAAAGKANAALMPVMNYLRPLDLATAGLSVAVFVLCLARRWWALPLRAALAIVVLLTLFIASPDAFKGGFDLDTRFIVMAAIIVPAAIVPVALPRRAAWAIGIGFLLLFSARMAVLLTVWHRWAGDLAAFRAVIAPLQPGDVVLTVRQSPAKDDRWASVVTARHLSDGTVLDSHLPALLLIEHRAWWPFLFDNQSQQPIETREPFRTLAARIDASPDPVGLLTSHELQPVTHLLLWGHAPAQERSAAGDLSLVAENEEAALFAVTSDKIRPPPSPPFGR
jgi:hypothetical protein